MTIHISARPQDIAETVLLPGDPLRARGIAETFLEDVVCYSEVRGMLGFTGTWQGKRVSVQGTGMGMPSTAIYVHELLALGAKRLIRVGTCGAYHRHLHIGDLIIAMSACTDSAVNRHIFFNKDYAPTATFRLLQKAVQVADEQGLQVQVGSVLSSDSFYNAQAEHWKTWAAYGVLGVEMETAALYTLAARQQAEALTILTVSDNLVTGQLATAEERQNNFDKMARIALQLV